MKWSEHLCSFRHGTSSSWPEFSFETDVGQTSFFCLWLVTWCIAWLLVLDDEEVILAAGRVDVCSLQKECKLLGDLAALGKISQWHKSIRK